MSDIEVKELKISDFPIWDELVKNSPYGTIFHSSMWLDICSKIPDKTPKIYGIFENNELFGGCSFYINKTKKFFKTATSICELSPYGGIIFSQSPAYSVRKQEEENSKYANCLIKKFKKDKYDHIQLVNSPEFIDVRPFTWNGWGSSIRYAYYLDLNNFNYSKTVVRNIKRAKNAEVKVDKSIDLDSFCKLYEKTFLHQELNPPVNEIFLKNVFDRLHKNNKGEMWIARTESGEVASADVIIYDDKRAYLWLATSDHKLRKIGAHYYLLSIAFEDMQKRGFKEINLMCGNMDSLATFASGFNPDLVPYFGVENSSFLYKLIMNTFKTLRTKSHVE